ncbi:hypothetical protein VNO78_10775 [Psophocarpus tetragonolobus]|uniref:Uncharacterized protein n=1 Tax=Psophocarpus tetragonolobus TaxID=3891 RepID=A0AAN9SKA7_PSOTE
MNKTLFALGDEMLGVSNVFSYPQYIDLGHGGSSHVFRGICAHIDCSSRMRGMIPRQHTVMGFRLQMGYRGDLVVIMRRLGHDCSVEKSPDSLRSTLSEKPSSRFWDLRFVNGNKISVDAAEDLNKLNCGKAIYA